MGEAGRGEGREQVDEAEDGEGGGSALNKGPTRVVERRKGGGVSGQGRAMSRGKK